MIDKEIVIMIETDTEVHLIIITAVEKINDILTQTITIVTRIIVVVVVETLTILIVTQIHTKKNLHLKNNNKIKPTTTIIFLHQLIPLQFLEIIKIFLIKLKIPTTILLILSLSKRLKITTNKEIVHPFPWIPQICRTKSLQHQLFYHDLQYIQIAICSGFSSLKSSTIFIFFFLNPRRSSIYVFACAFLLFCWTYFIIKND